MIRCADCGRPRADKQIIRVRRTYGIIVPVCADRENCERRMEDARVRLCLTAGQVDFFARSAVARMNGRWS